MNYNDYFTQEELETANEKELKKIRRTRLLLKGSVLLFALFVTVPFKRYDWMAAACVFVVWLFAKFVEAVAFPSDRAAARALQKRTYFFREDTVTQERVLDLETDSSKGSNRRHFLWFAETRVLFDVSHRKVLQTGTEVVLQMTTYERGELIINVFPRKTKPSQ